MGLKFVPKVKVTDKHSLAVIYTPGVAAACLAIKENIDSSFDYTNRENTVGVFAFDYEKALKRAEFLKTSLNIDAVPIEISSDKKEDIKLVVENLEATFGAIDLSQISDFAEDIDFEVNIPVLVKPVSDLKEFFLCVSKNIFMLDLNKLTGTLGEQSLTLRKMSGGSIEAEYTKDKHIKPVGVVTEGSAVLGLGNIGAFAALPVMEGKSVLFSSLAGLSAIPICIKEQISDTFVKIVKLIGNSFSAINLEDIAAPRCFGIEKEIVKNLDIPVFHDDAHGTSVVVLAGIYNALKVTGKRLEDVKIVMSGAGAAGYTIAKLLLFAGAKNLIVCDREGALVSGGSYEKPNHIELSALTNPNGETGTLKEVIKKADVFIGVSAPNLLDENDIKNMAEKPIVFALANPTPEIMPEIAERAGAEVVATGRSDFKNQINNCLAFPGLFKGLLEHNVKKVTSEIKVNCAKALASAVSEDKLSKDYIIPDALDEKVVDIIAGAVRV
ncbi:MAG: hypothetical protein K6C94_08735 [Candidatus Gastranaerophilales bacterium]|nr:hypothetical protein [Candidatus Gastranaerophilales bacterium]